MKIEIYTIENCSWCNRAEKLMKICNLDYKKYVVGQHINREDAIERFDELFKKKIGYPIIIIDGIIYDVVSASKFLLEKGLFKINKA